MAKVFISYSRKDIDFAKRLTGELQKSKLDFWIDWEGIPPTVDWWKEIEKGIEESDAFLFIISPDSSKSEVCLQEIDYAVKNGKRLIPLVVRETSGDEAPQQLTHLNWIFFRETDDFDASLAKLLTSIHIDFDWVEVQRRLQVRALEWERNHKENSFLLHGKDLQNAEFQLLTNSSKEPYPTQLQSEFVIESRENEDRQKLLSQRRRNIISIIGIILLIIVVLGVTGQLNRFIYRPVDMEDYWATIPAGEFLMGSEAGESDETPVHTVYLDEFQIGKYEVTNRQYAQCVKAGVCTGGEHDDNKALHPVVNVNWYDAVTYCEWVDGRLPTEAEWEKAASWDTETQTKFVYPWGDNEPTPDLLHYGGYYVGDNTTPVGNYPAGENGLFDMAGNVSEWTSSLYQPYPYDTTDGREDMKTREFTGPVLRGGSFIDSGYNVRSASRSNWLNPVFTASVTGFRCSRSP